MINLRLYLGIEARRPHVRHHTDYFPPLNLASLDSPEAAVALDAADREALSNRVFPRPIAPRSRFVEDRYELSIGCIALGKRPALFQRNSHRREVIRRDRLLHHSRRVGLRTRGN